ncbi:hypothetical protein EV126DRAFT_427619 [Verticillium dahliae]|nr:hypothetical protein EV126DRAFT_427619 [Verticillium dahliae]
MSASRAVAKTWSRSAKSTFRSSDRKPATGPEWLHALDAAKKTVQADVHLTPRQYYLLIDWPYSAS